MKIYNADDVRRVADVMDLATKFLHSLPDGVVLQEFAILVENDTSDYKVATIEFEDDFAVADIIMEYS